MDRMMGLKEGTAVSPRFKPEIRCLWQSEPLSLSECYRMIPEHSSRILPVHEGAATELSR